MANLKLSKEEKKILLFKPSMAIAVEVIEGDFTLLKRKIYNILLYNFKQNILNNYDFYNSDGVYDTTGDFTEIPTKSEIALKELKKLAGYNSKNNKYFKKQIEGLQQITINYNILNKDKQGYGKSVLIPTVEFYSNNVVQYKLPDLIIDKLINLTVFAKIDLDKVKQFTSKYELIAYELNQDYCNVQIPNMSKNMVGRIFNVSDKYRNMNEYMILKKIKALRKNGAYYKIIKTEQPTQQEILKSVVFDRKRNKIICDKLVIDSFQNAFPKLDINSELSILELELSINPCPRHTNIGNLIFERLHKRENGVTLKKNYNITRFTEQKIASAAQNYSNSFFEY